jgi:hypothetical protein
MARFTERLALICGPNAVCRAVPVIARASMVSPSNVRLRWPWPKSGVTAKESRGWSSLASTLRPRTSIAAY